MLQASRELLKKMDKMDLIKFSVSLKHNSPSTFICMPISYMLRLLCRKYLWMGHRTESHIDRHFPAFQMALRSLHSAAAISGRALAWPYLNCSTVSRLAQEIDIHPTLKRHDKRRHRSSPVPFNVVQEKHMCMWTDYMSTSCLGGES